ncbi:DNA-binding response regulator [Ectopseudomonas toyotomiensis]|uniref:Two-component system, OmpR family, copper resistance phosphate regulon response regulator CusR n=1 Tax=Ectopseudomonas toyotomiensis TaxID=554344 RepID=A0A1I5XTH5_9GAMM|nr:MULTISPECIES: heavy metal response regulator transcription factor [Pseudomonas]AQZ32986.1 DNA-binding response regulator [Pseudomonas sp. LPH1]PIA70275.1 DNA-binding response regulator [Pseudomonas toyotomiensis]SFQ35255.1 two-component system, OmpR family, copper resistance phosphate regulon response regulator CusR [Pseudomonas toyotomiensis]
MNILVVEDELKAGNYLCNGLQEQGYSVSLARNGADGLHLALENAFDVIVLDVMMPEMDGWEVLRRLRQQADTPVLFLTARDDVVDRIKGLELGADDYLIKPFSFAELVARLRTLTRRGPTREEEHLQVDDLQIDVLKRRVIRGGVRLALTNKEFALLHLFVTHQGQVLSRTLIASRVWDMNFDSDTNVVDVAVRRLRMKVDEPFQNRLIHSVRGIGYRFDTQP